MIDLISDDEDEAVICTSVSTADVRACPRCTLENARSLPRCEACGHLFAGARPTLPPAPAAAKAAPLWSAKSRRVTGAVARDSLQDLPPPKKQKRADPPKKRGVWATVDAAPPGDGDGGFVALKPHHTPASARAKRMQEDAARRRDSQQKLYAIGEISRWSRQDSDDDSLDPPATPAPAGPPPALRQKTLGEAFGGAWENVSRPRAPVERVPVASMPVSKTKYS